RAPDELGIEERRRDAVRTILARFAVLAVDLAKALRPSVRHHKDEIALSVFQSVRETNAVIARFAVLWRREGVHGRLHSRFNALLDFRHVYIGARLTWVSLFRQ